jgi:hypothetical protein
MALHHGTPKADGSGTQFFVEAWAKNCHYLDNCQLRRLGARGGAGKPTLLSLKN